MVPQFAATAEAKAERRRLFEREASASKFVELLIGDAIGDAFGFGVEMQDAFWIRQAVVDFTVWPSNPVLYEEFRENNVRGFYSDDAEMTVGLMKALVKEGASGLDAEGMLRAWKAEWDLANCRPPPAVPGAGHPRARRRASGPRQGAAHAGAATGLRRRFLRA
mmetsp:Transcript_14146/g.45705  ORF Transcript_14146/g.45705 Transcript_14146/m.45705 type:complete len:164 (-) Transcript_14146:636-1127(-)